jgi:ATP-binding cassette subfamily B protein RaxB
MKYLSLFQRNKLQLTLQSERSECGLACLAMLANFHGHSVTLNDLRGKFEISRRGANLPQLIRFANRLHLEARPIKCEITALPKLRLPAILHWNMNHYVILHAIVNDSYEIFDPAIGKRLKSLNEISSSFTGVALEIWPQPNFQKQETKDRFSIKQYLGNFSGFGGQILKSFLLSLCIMIFGLLTPIIMQVLYDEGFASANFGLITSLVLGLCFITGFQIFAQYVRTRMQIYLASRLSLYSASALYSHLLKLPMRYFERRSSYDIASRFSSNEALKTFLLSGVTSAILDGFMTIFMLSFMFLYSFKMTLTALGAALLIIAIRLVYLPTFRQLSLEAIHQKARIQGNMLETIRAMQSIKLYQGESVRQAVWQNDFVQSLNNDTRTSQFTLNFQSTNQIIAMIEKAVTLAIGASMVFSKDLTPGMFIAFLSYKEQFFSRILSFLDSFIQYRMQALHLDRIADIALTAPERLPTQDIRAEHIEGSIRMENVSFRYDEESKLLFKDLDFAIEAGENVAIVGPSGQGKSTLLKLMVGLLKADEGDIFIGGYSIASNMVALQSIIATVMQDDRLISGTIADNIAFFDSTPDQERIIEAAQKAAIHSDILKMPMGYSSLIGDQGTALSGGQMQRVLIARALYKNPKILLMDEATSHLDFSKERAINEEIRKAHMTRIVVAHRRETIMNADRIFMLTDKQLVEIGKEEYLANSGTRSDGSRA